MGKAIRGITVEIGGDTSKLGKALEGVNRKSKDLQSELKGVNSLLKFDPGNVELLRQKQELLNQSILNTKEKLTTLKDTQAQVQEQFDKGEITEEQYRDFQREIVATEQKLKGLTDQLKEFGSVGAQQISEVGEKIKGVGEKTTEAGKKMSVLSGASAGVLAGGVKSAMDMDVAYDTIITKTGATGDALKDLTTQADELFKSLPIDADVAGVAVGEVNTRFGVTGETLKDLSAEFIKFSEINNTDLNSAIDSTDSIMTKFGLDSSETGNVLGLLTKIGQDTGLSMDVLQSTLSTNGATLKELGLDITGSANLLAQFETNGVDASAALMALKKAQQNATAEGKTMSEALKETVGNIKNASSETEALQTATELFGKKGAVEMTQAILEGRFSIEDLTSSLSTYGDTVGTTFEETLDPWDKTKVSMNNLKVAGAELGTTFLTTVAPIIDKLVTKVKELTTKFSGLSEGAKKAIVVALGIVTALGPVLIVIGKVISAVGKIMTVVPKIVSGVKMIAGGLKALWGVLMANPIVLIVAAIAGLVAGFIYLWRNCEGFRDFWINLWEKIKEVTSRVVDAIKTFFIKTIPNAFTSFGEKVKSVFTAIGDFFRSIPEKVASVFDRIKNKIGELPNGFQLAFQNVKTIIENFVNIFKNYFNIIKTVVQTVVAVIKAIFSGDFASIGGIISDALEKIKGFFSNIFDSIVTIVVNWIAMIINYFRGVGESIVAVFKKIGEKLLAWWEEIKTFFTVKVPEIINNIVTWFKELPGKIWDAIISAVTKLAEWGVSMYEKAKSVALTVITTVVTFYKELPGKIWNAIISAVTKIGEWGVNMKNKAVEGMRNMVTGIMDTIKSLPEKFVSVGKDVISGLWNGISGAISGLYENIKSSLSGLVDKAKDALGIHSPSRVFADVIGKQIPAGIAQGIDKNSGVADKAVENMTDNLTDEAVNLNGATINRKLNSTFTATADNIRSISDVMSTIREYGERLIKASSRAIVLDSGALVGETIGDIDAGLASLQLLKGRGV